MVCIQLRTPAMCSFLGVGWAVVGVGCAVSEAPEGVVASRAPYAVSWNTEGVAMDAQGQGWSVQTALGYQVRLEQGHLVNYRVQLVPCEEESAQASTGWSSVPMWPLLAISSVAVAGHDGQDDPSITLESVAESLAGPARVELETTEFPSRRYCQVHYLLARGEEETRSLPESIDLVNRSLVLEGQVTGPAEMDPTPFVLETAWPMGVLIDIPDTVVAGQDGELNVHLRRDLGGLFEGVDFDGMDADSQVWQVLHNIVDGMEWVP